MDGIQDFRWNFKPQTASTVIVSFLKCHTIVKNLQREEFNFKSSNFNGFVGEERLLSW